MALTGDIDNYPGFEEGIDGFTLGMKMQQSAERFGAVTKYTEIKDVFLSQDVKRLVSADGEILAKNVIIATGAYPRELGLEGEQDYIGRGIHYCAHCDGRFYKGKTVVVVGGGNSAAEDALYLSKLAKKVYVVHRRDKLRAEKVYHEPLNNASNIEFIWDTAVTGFEGTDRVEAAKLENLKNGEKSILAADAIFVSIGRKPATEFLGESVSLDSHGYIVAGEDTKTNIPGVFAVGDVRTKMLRQVVTAVADGAVAVAEIGNNI